MTTMKLPDGLHANRLDPKCGNPREVAFAEQWVQEHAYSNLLSTLFVVPCVPGTPGAIYTHSFGHAVFPLGVEPTERDRIVAATLMQWLGSNCGMSFLREALDRVGYRIQYPETK
jgi:hypothetical protein